MLFNSSMTQVEAWKVLFSACEGKSKEERKKILEEYKKVLPDIIDKELDGPPAMTSYQF